jgi:hypothetical protein
VSDIWHKIKGHIGPNLAFLYGGHDLGRRATKKKRKKKQIPEYLLIFGLPLMKEYVL